MKRIVSGIMLTLLLTSMLTFAINIQQVNASYFFNSMGPVLKSKEKHIAISFPKPIIAKIGRYDWPKIENCSYLTNPGQPTLPVKSVVVKLPEKSNITNIEVKVKETLLQGSFSILPVPSPTTLDSQIPGKISEDPTIYQANSFFPKEWYVCHEAHGIDVETTTRVKYLILNLFPLRFLPVENKLIQAEKISITVTYVESPEILTPSAELKNLIITSPTLEQYALELAEWKNDTGIPSKTVNTTWIYSHYGGVDNQEKIRNCIKDFVATYGITYVTIFGDADQVPVRYVYVPDDYDTYTPTDLYYADLDGTWDDNGDGLYADQRYDEVDGIPDVYIGRIPPSLVEYAQTAVDKIKGYQQQFDTSQNWTQRIVLAAGTGHNGIEDPFGIAFPFLKDYIANITTDKDIVKLYESAGNLSTASMASEINEGALFVNFAGHGDPGTGLGAVGWLFYWVVPGLIWNGFGISDVQSLTNGFKLPVVTTIACSTARFDDTDCIGEWFVLEPDGGSIAYFGATRVAYGWPEEMSPYGLMGEMDRRIYESFYEGCTRLGQMWGEAISGYVQSHIWNYEYASVYDVKTFMEYVLLGDPTLRVHARHAGWATTEVVSTESTGESRHSSLAVEYDGTVHVAWEDRTDYNGAGTDSDIFYRKYVPCTGWTPTEIISAESTGDSEYPSLAVGFDGTVHIAWHDNTDYSGSGSDTDVFYKKYVPDTGWTLTAAVSTESTNASLCPSLAVSCDGTVHVAWTDRTDYNGAGTDSDIFYKRYVPSAGWTITEVVSDLPENQSHGSYYPSLDVGCDGTVHIAWYDEYLRYWQGYVVEDDFEVLYKKYVPDTGWTVTEIVSMSDSWLPGMVSLAVGHDGTVHIAWDAYVHYEIYHPGYPPYFWSGELWDVYYKRYVPDTGWTATEDISVGDYVHSENPSLAVDYEGTVHISWHENTTAYLDIGSGWEIFYKKHIPSVSWTMAEVVSTESTGDSWGSSLAVDCYGTVHVAWTDRTDYGGCGSDTDIFWKKWSSGVLKVPKEYPTIQQAINAASPGDTIGVAPGIYNEDVNIGKPLNLVGSGSTLTHLGSIRISADDVSVLGFRVENSTEGLWSWPFGIVVDGADSCTIEWNFIEYGVNLAYSNYTRIQHNAIEGQIIMGSPFDGGGIGGGVNNTVADNDINAEVWPFGCGNFRFCNNTFRGELSVEGSSALIENNHFIGASLDLWTSTADIHNNTIERGGIYIPGKLGSSGSIIGNRICNYGGTAIHSTTYGDMVNSLFIIKQNYICNNTCGIDASGLQSGSIIYENILQENDVGIKIHSVFEYWPTGDPHIYHNDFIQNQQQVSLWGFYTTPSWNDSYPSGGNYWSGYAGVDFYSGPNQDQLGSDGIGDTPYIIDASNQDNYPLMNPYCGARVRFYTRPSSSDFGITYQGRSYHDGETDVFECGTSGPAYASCLDDWCWEFYFWDPTGGVNVDPVWDPSTTVTILGDGTLCAIFEGRLFDIFLNSSEVDGSTSYLGTIIFDGEPCPLWEIHRTCGIYSVEYIPAPGYVFDYWEAWGCVGLINDSTVIVEPVNPPDIPPYATGGLTAYYRESEDYFDLGTPSSPVASGYIGVNEASLYASGVGYGWIDAPSLDSRDRGAPDDLRRDLVCSRNDATFCVDLSDGDYTVTLIIGDASYTQDMIDVHAEGVLVVDDLTVFKGAFQEISFVVTVADGHLNLRFHNDGGRSTHWVCNAITIEPTAFYTVHLESVENTGETSNLGYITFDGSSYALPSDSSKAAGSYEVSFTADGHVLDHWETSGGISVSRSIVTVIGDGTLRAVYKVAPAGWYFDLGTPSSPVASGYVGVNETTLYDSSLGYGWINAPSLDSRDRGAPDDLKRDLCCSRQDATFCVDIPNGDYTVTLIMGDNSYTQDLIDVYCEDILVVNDLAVLKGTFQEISFTVTVDDGQLNLRFHNDGGVSTHWVCNAITIETPSTLYNVHLESIEDTSATSSLGSIVFDGQSYTLPADLSKPEGTYEISYTAALGYVFDHWETSGDVSISGSALIVTGDGILTAVYKAVEGWYFDLGTPSSPVEPGYIGVNETTLYDTSLGYGWVNAPGLDSRDRGSPDDLRRDFVCSRNDATFNVDVPDGDYTVTLIVGDGAYTQDMIDVYAEGVLVINDLTAQKGTFQEVSFTVTVIDGQLNLTFHNDGGISTNWVCNAIVVRSLGIIRVPQDYLTIQEAIDNASSGDTILVSPGNYEGFIFRCYTNSITVIGTNRNATIINGTVGFDIHGYSSNHKLINFTVRNGGVHISAEEMVGLDVINNTITDCDVGISAWGSSKGHYENIVNNTVVGNNVGIEYSGVGTHSPYPKIVGNHVSNNSVIGVYLSGHWDHTPLPEFWGNNITNNGAGIYVTGFTSGTISENLISNNDDYGLCVDSSFGISVANNSITNNGFGIQGSSEGFGGKISGNIITNSTFDGINLHCSSATIENNTITHNGAAGVWMYDSSGTITRNLISDNDDNGVFMDTGIHDSGSIKQNIITNNEGDGINLAGDVIVISNTIWNNLNGVRCCETSNEKGPKVNFNDIYENEKWNLIADPWAAPYDGSVNATYNWWGTTNQTLIEQGVSGNVTFIPYLWNSISSEDFLPPSIQNVELSPSNPSYHMDVNVTAKVKDNVMVDSVIFSYRANSEWSNVTMEQSEELFQTSIPKQPLRNHTGSTVEPQWETTAFFLYRGLRCSLRLF